MSNIFELLQQLNEMSPQIELKELPHFMTKFPFYSETTIKDDFIILEEITNFENESLVVAIAKDKSKAIIGKWDIRSHDNKPGISFFGRLLFKDQLDLSKKDLEDIHPENVVQVDEVEVLEKFKRRGYGFLLYFTLIKNGYTIISDNVQYLVGGQALWKKIAKKSKVEDFKVYILDDADFRTNSNGEILAYDGLNIDDSDLWSPSTKHFYTLFVASK
jgi:hypothetical protein